MEAFSVRGKEPTNLAIYYVSLNFRIHVPCYLKSLGLFYEALKL